MKKKTNDEGLDVGPLLAKEKWERLVARIAELGPYELATLAARICPELCLKNPVEAIGKARRLLITVGFEAKKSDSELMAAIAQSEAKRRVSYEEGIKQIIPWVRRPGRAREYFESFLLRKYPTKQQANTALCGYERNGFSGLEVIQLGKEIAVGWSFREKKGKQGQVKNPEKDARKKPKIAPLPQRVRERLGRSGNESE